MKRCTRIAKGLLLVLMVFGLAGTPALAQEMDLFEEEGWSGTYDEGFDDEDWYYDEYGMDELGTDEWSEDDWYSDDEIYEGGWLEDEYGEDDWFYDTYDDPGDEGWFDI